MSMDITTPDGRTLDVLASESGDLPLVVHGGTPSAAVPYQPLLDAAAARGLRLVTYSRPGYGPSTPQPGRTVATAVGDVETILDALDADRFLTVGWSGGGPHALACAALLPQRCLGAAVIAGVAPWDAEGLDFLAGQGAENIEEWAAATQGFDALSAWLESASAGLGQVTSEQLGEALGDLAPQVDRDAMRGGLADWLAAMFRKAVSSGIAGWRDDDLAFLANWGFDVSQVGRPVLLWQGSEDRMVPLAHGRWLADRIPGVTAEILPGEGHISLLAGDRLGRMLDALAALAAAG
jgi:pimeloyl-ACP methyl ester carboxylesterase